MDVRILVRTEEGLITEAYFLPKGLAEAEHFGETSLIVTRLIYHPPALVNITILECTVEYLRSIGLEPPESKDAIQALWLDLKHSVKLINSDPVVKQAVYEHGKKV